MSRASRLFFLLPELSGRGSPAWLVAYPVVPGMSPNQKRTLLAGKCVHWETLVTNAKSVWGPHGWSQQECGADLVPGFSEFTWDPSCVLVTATVSIVYYTDQGRQSSSQGIGLGKAPIRASREEAMPDAAKLASTDALKDAFQLFPELLSTGVADNGFALDGAVPSSKCISLAHPFASQQHSAQRKFRSFHCRLAVLCSGPGGTSNRPSMPPGPGEDGLCFCHLLRLIDNRSMLSRTRMPNNLT